jgi:outer membrane murein-binding lipoprotein Lpp
VADLLAHPLTVATYAILLPVVIAGVRALVRLFGRMGDVERAVSDLDGKVDALALDLRKHMAEEADAAKRLDTQLTGLRMQMSALVSEPQPGR